MCFSASASFTAGALLSAAGITTISQVSTIPQRFIASIPLLFGVQQIAEGFVWLGLMHNHTAMAMVGSYIFLTFASVIWPLFVPLVMQFLDPKHPLYFIPSFLAGLSVVAWFFVKIIPTGIEVAAQQCNIAYTVASPEKYQYAVLASMLYLIATVLPFFLVHERTAKAIGVILLISYAVAAFTYTHAFISVWCFFAAIISILSIIMAVRHKRMHR